MTPEIIGQSVIGPGHREEDMPCQDNWEADVSDEYMVVSVGDGLGSSAKADVGSEIATTTAVDVFSEWLSDQSDLSDLTEDEVGEVYGEAYSAARNAIKNKVDNEEERLEEYHTTLSIAVVTQDWYAAGAVGDSGIVGITPDGSYISLVSREDSSTMSSTVPITGSAKLIEEKKRFSFDQSPIAVLAMFTDGFERFVWDQSSSSQPRRNFFNRISDFAFTVDSFTDETPREEFYEFVDSDHFHEYSRDDKTLVVGRIDGHVSSELVAVPGQWKYDDSEFVEGVQSIESPSISDVADYVGCSHTTASERLSMLEDGGEVASNNSGREVNWSVVTDD